MSHQALYLVHPGRKSGAFEMRDVATSSKSLAKGEVRIRVTHSGVNFADVLAGEGNYEDAPKAPSIIGYEVAGLIEETSSPVFKTGDRVVAMTRFGGYQSQVVLPDSQVNSIPKGLSESEALAFGVQGTTAHYAAYELANIQEGDAVLIQAAAGGVGSLLIQLAKARRAHVTAVVSSQAKVEFVKSLGADDVFVSSEVSLAKMYDREWDVVFDSVGGTSLRLALKSLRAGGRAVSFGVAAFSGGTIFRVLKTAAQFGVFSPIQFLAPSKSLMGVNILKLVDQKPLTVQRNMRQVLALAAEGRLKVRVDSEFPVHQIEKALDRLRSRQSMGKVVLQW
jgi:NADPH:quinone reductase-like Zn-dependent oxidoreductase